MATITTEITATEMKCLEYAAVSPSDWTSNVVEVRVEKAKKEIIEKLVEHCNENDITIATGVDAQITQAYDLGVVDTLANVEAQIMADIQAQNAE